MRPPPPPPLPSQQQQAEPTPPTASRATAAAAAPAPTKPSGPVQTAFRWHTMPPTPEQLGCADAFFLKHPPKLLWSEAKFRQIDIGTAPEVVFLGRSNVGKSTLLNALLNNKHMAYTSSKPGRTRLMSAFSVCSGKVLLVDMPGYGHASQAGWGTEIMKYLRVRRQFRRAFVLLDAKHGPKPADVMLLDHLGHERIPHQIVLSKADRLNTKDGSLQKAFDQTRHLIETGASGPVALGEILAVAAEPAKKGISKMGLSDLRWAILSACGYQ